jgi:hypothetical protein
LYFHPSSCFRERRERSERRERRGNLSFFDFYEPSVPRFLLFLLRSLSSFPGFEQKPVPRFFLRERAAQKRKKKADKVWRHLPESVISYQKTQTHNT